jgi:Domain of unknown function (DUF4148)
MKVIFRVMLGALLSAWLVTSAFAQTSQSPCDPSAQRTRADVRAELVQWRAAGYDPLDWIDYPENAQHAGNIVWHQRAAAGQIGNCM